MPPNILKILFGLSIAFNIGALIIYGLTQLLTNFDQDSRRLGLIALLVAIASIIVLITQ